jgi:serine/threonine protein kinase
LKLLDFGYAKELEYSSMGLHSLVGTKKYAAPEMFEPSINTEGNYNYRVDLWSLGVLIYFLCT